ncbi:RebB family R body protein [Rhodovibrionaceae bacterium A322]
MATPTALNDQITDSVAQSALVVMGTNPTVSLAAMTQSFAHSTSLLYESAVANFQQLSTAGQAATNQGVIQIYSVSSMAGAVATGRIARAAVPSAMTSRTLAELVAFQLQQD